MMQLDYKPKRLSPLHNQHQSLNAHFNLQGAWLIPEVYTTAEDEAKVLQESVGLTDISVWGKLNLKGAQASRVVSAHFGNTPTEPGDVIEIESNHTLVAELTFDEFFVLTPPDAETKMTASLESEIASQEIFASIVDQTAGLAGLSIVGQKSTELMRKLCAIPFNTVKFPNLHVAQSSFAKVWATIIRHDQGNSPAFQLFADRSYGEYLWDAILDAGREFGIQPVGWEALER